MLFRYEELYEFKQFSTRQKVACCGEEGYKGEERA